LHEAVGLGASAEDWHAGVGSYAQDTVLLRAYPAYHTPQDVAELDPAPESSAIVLQAQTRPPGAAPEAAQPLRVRPRLFIAAGALPEGTRWRDTLEAELPSYLQNRVSSYGAKETLFAYFLKKLRETGRTEDPRLPADVAAQVLAATAQRLQQASSGKLELVL